MKIVLLLITTAALTAFFSVSIVTRQKESQLSKEREIWEAQKAELQAELDLARSTKSQPVPRIIETTEIVREPEEPDAARIIEELQQIKISSSAQTKDIRRAVQHFENLIACGNKALVPIREFLLLNIEIDYDSSVSPRASRDGKISTDFVLPPSLRFGLLDATRQIGGEAAESLLAEILSTTGRGAEIAYLARVLEQAAPGKYRDVALTAARELLSTSAAAHGPGLDKYDREYLFGVLTFLGDSSFVGDAQAQLVRADGTVDRGALKYIQQTAAAGAMPLISQLYQQANVEKKEPLARYALNFAGLDANADALWRKGILDPALTHDERVELIEDLNQDGYENLKNLTARDLNMITNRLALINRHRPEADHKVISAAFDEAERDLRRMLERAFAPPAQ